MTNPYDDLVIPVELEVPIVQSTWARVDLESILAGTHVPEEPSLMARSDGQHLLYPGRIHSFHGESESGKSLVAQAVAADMLSAGQRVLYVDFESDAAAVVGRLATLGATTEQIRANFEYRRPETSPYATGELGVWTQLVATPYDLIVLDGVGDALGTYGASVNDNDDVAAWMRLVPRVLAERTGAAVILIDHVTKSSESRGRFAVGAQAKMNGLTGAAYLVEIGAPIGIGMTGHIRLRIAKDRPGGIRPHCGDWRAGDRTQAAATLTVDATTPGRTVVTIDAPDTTPSTTGSPIRLSGLLEKISRLLETAREPMSRSAVMDALRHDGSKAKNTTIDAALNTLTDEHYITETPGARGARMFRHTAAYRANNDPQSDSYIPPMEEPT